MHPDSGVYGNVATNPVALQRWSPKIRVHSCPGRMLEVNRSIESTAGKNKRICLLRDVDSDVGMLTLEPLQARNEPPNGEGMRLGDSHLYLGCMT